MNHDVHVAVQIIPLGSNAPYPLIDKAIEVIARSGISYQVGAMETVLQGPYDRVMKVIDAAQSACMEAGAEELVVNIKVHRRRAQSISWNEKLAKYGG